VVEEAGVPGENHRKQVDMQWYDDDEVHFL
jgi:hypothetical protein